MVKATEKNTVAAAVVTVTDIPTNTVTVMGTDIIMDTATDTAQVGVAPAVEDMATGTGTHTMSSLPMRAKAMRWKSSTTPT